MSHACASCKEQSPQVVLQRCGQCRTTAYCSQTCQREHWHKHWMHCRPRGPVAVVTLVPVTEPLAIAATAPVAEPIAITATAPVAEPIAITATAPVAEPIAIAPADQSRVPASPVDLPDLDSTIASCLGELEQQMACDMLTAEACASNSLIALTQTPSPPPPNDSHFFKEKLQQMEERLNRIEDTLLTLSHSYLSSEMKESIPARKRCRSQPTGEKNAQKKKKKPKVEVATAPAASPSTHHTRSSRGQKFMLTEATAHWF